MFQNSFRGGLILLFIYHTTEWTTAEERIGNNVTNEWTEDWLSPPSGNRNLSLLFVDNFVALYFDEHISNSTTWPGPLLSKGWKYLQNVYEPLDINFRLTVVLHEDKFDNECYILAIKSTTSQNKTGRHRHRPPSSSQVDCGSNSKQTWAVETPTLFERLFLQLAKIIQNTSNVSSSDSEGISSCLGHISEIIFYDIYIYLKGITSADLLKWKSKRLIPEPYYGSVYEANCFRDWYYPNYEKYGEAQVLKDFFRLTKAYKSSSSVSSQNSTFTMNDEEFFHFWSEAAGTDLNYWVIPKLKWRKVDFHARLAATKLAYRFNYTRNDMLIV